MRVQNSIKRNPPRWTLPAQGNPEMEIDVQGCYPARSRRPLCVWAPKLDCGGLNLAEWEFVVSPPMAPVGHEFTYSEPSW